MHQLPIYAPDQAFRDNKVGASDMVVNLYPAADGYTSVPDFVRISTNAISGIAKGVVTAVLADASESTFTVIGTTTGLYTIKNNVDGVGQRFVDISKPGGYKLSVEDSWSMVVFGSYIIAANINYPLQILDLRKSSEPQFADLTEAPRASHVAVWGNHLAAIGVLNTNTGYRNSVAWSGLNNPHDWKFADKASDADEQQFFDGGVVLAATSSKSPLIFARDKIYRGSYVPSSALIFTFVDISSRISIKGTNSIIEIDDAVYFYSDKGFYSITNQNVITNIGNSLLNNFVKTNFDNAALNSMAVTKDVGSTRIFWAIASTFATGKNDFILVYDYTLGKWSTLNRIVQIFTNYTSPGYTLEQLDTVNKELDKLPFSLDSGYWQSGQKFTWAIDGAGYLAAMSGTQMEASIRTGLITDVNNGFITMTGATLDSTTDGYTVDLLYTDNRKNNMDYRKYFKQYGIPASKYRDEALFNIRAKYIKIQYNLKSTKLPYFIYTFDYRILTSGYM